MFPPASFRSRGEVRPLTVIVAVVDFVSTMVRTLSSGQRSVVYQITNGYNTHIYIYILLRIKGVTAALCRWLYPFRPTDINGGGNHYLLFFSGEYRRLRGAR